MRIEAGPAGSKKRSKKKKPRKTGPLGELPEKDSNLH
jgi:hypothetical protein